MNYFYQFNTCNLVLRKSVASHFSKGEGMSRIKLQNVCGLYNGAIFTFLLVERCGPENLV